MYIQKVTIHVEPIRLGSENQNPCLNKNKFKLSVIFIILFASFEIKKMIQLVSGVNCEPYPHLAAPLYQPANNNILPVQT